MTYLPKYNQNQINNFNDFHFSLWQLIKEILAYYNTLVVGKENYCREMQKGAVFFGYSDQNLNVLNNNSQIEWLLTIQYDVTNTANIINNSRQSFSELKKVVLPYQFNIRCLPTNLATKSQADPKFRIETIFNKLEKDLCNSDFKFEIIPNTIQYQGVIQTELSNKKVYINCQSNKLLDNRFVDNEAINNRQFVVGVETFQICFKQD